MDIPNGETEIDKDTLLYEEEAPGSDKFGKVIDALHKKQALPSLRTYQGDMAEFIKEKNESVISVAVKEKERKEKKEISMGEIKISSKPKGGRLQANLTMIFLSLLLVVGGAVGVMYAIQALKSEPFTEVVLEEKIIPYNNSITLVNATDANFGSELSNISVSNGINMVKISDLNGLPIQKAKDFFSFLKISLPFTLSRTLKDDYMVGLEFSGDKAAPFLVISVNDFGQAFSGMLDWEERMATDLSFLNVEPKTDMTSLIASTTTIPVKQESFRWKDIIVKNKDTRGLVNEKGRSKVAYTFLDKSTILIVGDISAIGEIYSIYSSRSVAR